METLRYYESIGLLPSATHSPNGYRLYNDAQLSLILFVKRCRQFDISIAEIKQLSQLIQQPESGCLNVNQMVDNHLNYIEKMQELEVLRGNLLDLRNKCEQQITVKACGILQELLQEGKLI